MMNRWLVLAVALATACESSSSAPDSPLPPATDAAVLSPDAPVMLADAPAPALDAPVRPPDARGTGDAGAGATSFIYVGTFLGGLIGFRVAENGTLEALPGSPFDSRQSFDNVVVSPSHRFIYGVDRSAAKLVGHRLVSGVPEGDSLPGLPLDITGHPLPLAVDPMGHFLYLGISGTIAVFAIDPATGALNPVTGSPFPAGGGPVSLAAHPSGRFLYASAGVSGEVAAFTVDPTFGALHEITGSPFVPTPGALSGALVIEPHGNFLYTGGHRLDGWRIDGTSGALTKLDASPFPGSVGADVKSTVLAADPTGQFLYAVSNAGTTVAGFRIDATTGDLGDLPGSPYPGGDMPYSVAVDPSGRFVFIGNDDAAQISALSISPADGSLKKVEGSPFAANGLEPQIVTAAQ